jgi:hypothetical protein
MTQALCPHCRTTAGVTSARGGGYRCKLCGGPRVVSSDAIVALSGNEVPLLQEARRSGRARWLWLAASGSSALVAAGSLTFALVLVLLFDPTAIVTTLLLGLAALPLIFALWSFRRAGRARSAASAALHEARLGALRDTLGHGRELSANDVSRLLALPAETSENLLAELNVDDSITSTVTEAGDVTYRTASLRMRIDEAARAAGLDETGEQASANEEDAASRPNPTPGARAR